MLSGEIALKITIIIILIISIGDLYHTLFSSSSSTYLSPGTVCADAKMFNSRNHIVIF